MTKKLLKGLGGVLLFFAYFAFWVWLLGPSLQAGTTTLVNGRSYDVFFNLHVDNDSVGTSFSHDVLVRVNSGASVQVPSFGYATAQSVGADIYDVSSDLPNNELTGNFTLGHFTGDYHAVISAFGTGGNVHAQAWPAASSGEDYSDWLTHGIALLILLALLLTLIHAKQYAK